MPISLPDNGPWSEYLSNKYKQCMYFTQTEIRLDKLVVSSEYISTRLVRKGEITSYYVVRCLSSHKSPTAVGSLCFLKQTIVKEPFVDALMPYASTESNVDKYRRVYSNEIQAHKYVTNSVNYPGKHYSQLVDFWHDMQGVYHRFTVVTKYEEYGDLKHFIDYIKQQKIQLTETEIIYILNNILKSTVELYNVGVLHRDIKPENIFIDQFFQVKLGDFGISIVDQKDKKPVGAEKWGTYGYMAPEIYFQPSYSYPVDVWAIGTVLYQLVYLALPFGNDHNTYWTKANAFLKEIQHVSSYSDKLSKRLKDFVKRFFVKNPDMREKVTTIYNYEYIHEFRLMEITLSLKKKYHEHMKRVNSCNTVEIERYCLQQHSLHHEKVLQVVRYQQWGYFFFLSNLKIIALFNSDPNNKLIKIFPDYLDEVVDIKSDVYCVILEYVYKKHFVNIREHMQIKKKVYTKRLNTTIDNIVQHKDTLAIRLRTQLSKESKRQLLTRNGEPSVPLVKEYEPYLPTSANKDPINFENNTFQIFYFPQLGPPPEKADEQQKPQDNIPYTKYKASLIFNNSLVSKDEVLIQEIDHSMTRIDNIYHITKYNHPKEIAYSEKADHRNMLHHAQRLFSFVVTSAQEGSTYDFLAGYSVSEY